MTKDELKQSLVGIRKFTDNQKHLIRILYANRAGLTRQEIADKMFNDGHEHRLAGVLSALSKKIVLKSQETGGDDFVQYLDVQGSRLLMSQAFRGALDALPEIKAKALE